MFGRLWPINYGEASIFITANDGRSAINYIDRSPSFTKAIATDVITLE